MYIILLLASQLIFDIGIYGKAVDRPLPQESWEGNVLDLVKDANKLTNKISIFSSDWAKVNGTIELEKNKLIEKNQLDFEAIWSNWKKKDNNHQYYHQSQEKCHEHTYDSDVRTQIENEYKLVQMIIVKPLDMLKDNVEETLESLKTQTTILKELFPLKLRNCNNETSCTKERTWVSNELNRNSMALKYLQDKSINTLEVLRNVSYNMYKLKFTTKRDLFDLKNKYICCSLNKIPCKNITEQLDQFEPLNFETLVLELKPELVTTVSTTPKEIATQNVQEVEENNEDLEELLYGDRYYNEK